MVIPVPAELDIEAPEVFSGYGGKWLASTNGPPIFDDQRGELIVVFEDSSQSLLFEEQPLAANRLHPDPTSKAGLENIVTFSVSSMPELGQTIVLVNAPCTAGMYTISLKRRIRISATQWDDTLTPPPYAGVVEVVGDCSGGASPNDPPMATFLGDLRRELKQTYPRPAAYIGFPVPPPAAGHLVLTYPDSKIEVHGVIEAFHTGRESVVQWNAANPPELLIDFADPNAELFGLMIVFTQTTPYQAGAAQISEFVVDLSASRLYDVDGNLIHDDGSGGLLAGVVTPTQIR